MNPKQFQDGFPEIQAAIYGVALSLDSFLLNGIPCGVLQRAVFPEFLEKTAGNLLRDLAILEQQAPHAAVANQPEVLAALGSLRAKCQELIDLVTGLSSFRTLPLQQLRSAVAQIPHLREECVQRLEELEVCFRTPKPFYPSRPSHATAAMNAFLANLERMFEEERTASHAGAG